MERVVKVFDMILGCGYNFETSQPKTPKMSTLFSAVALSSVNMFSFLGYSNGGSRAILGIPMATSILEAGLLTPHIGLPLSAAFAIVKIGTLANVGNFV